jgi:hypothetical protein
MNIATLGSKFDIDIEIDKQQVLQHIGYGVDHTPSARITSLINEYTDTICDLIQPSFDYVVRDVCVVRDSRTVIEGPITFESEVLARLLENCDMAAIFLVTIGNHLEKMSQRLAREKLVLQSAILDAIGSDVVETVAAFVQSRIGELAAARDLYISRRFSPGYCDWDVRQQKELFKIIDGSNAGVNLTKNCLMLPQKSISGIIGIGGSKEKIENYNPCKTCERLDCRGRR